MYEGGVRVPTIVKWPGKGRAGAVCDEPVISTDFYPSILEMVGLPSTPAQHRDGKSFAPALRGESFERGRSIGTSRTTAIMECKVPLGRVRDGNYKLLEYFENGTVQLFNLKDDLGEQKNLMTS